MLKENLEQVQKNINEACERAGRNTDEVTLIAVSKTKPVEEQTPEDYEPVDNPAAEKYRIGITDEEIENMMEALK